MEIRKSELNVNTNLISNKIKMFNFGNVRYTPEHLKNYQTLVTGLQNVFICYNLSIKCFV